MWILVLIVLLFVVTPSFAEQNFSQQQYETSTTTTFSIWEVLSS